MSVSHPTNDYTDLKKSKEMSSEFNILYRSIICHLSVDVSKVKDVLRYSSNPQNFPQRCVPPSVYEDITSTEDLLDRLFPDYINPGNTFLLEEIVRNCGSSQCKILLKKYTSRFHVQWLVTSPARFCTCLIIMMLCLHYVVFAAIRQYYI